MSSPFQKTLTGNKPPMSRGDIVRDSDQTLRTAVYVPLEDCTVESGTFDSHEMEEISHCAKRHTTHDSEQVQARVKVHGPRYAYGREVERRDSFVRDEYPAAGCSSDSLAFANDNHYGNNPKPTRERFDDEDDDERSRNFVTHVKGNHRSASHHWTADGDLHYGNSSMNIAAYDDEGQTDNEDDLFLPEDNHLQITQHSARRAGHQSHRIAPSGEFNTSPSPSLRLPVRSSRVQKRPNVNNFPPTVPTSSISDAALLKRGLRRSKAAVMSKKTHGPNDPENILIVNLKENEKKSWAEICQILNERRIKEGKTPSFTPNGCHNRYNRNAPILFAAEGKEFITVSEQRKLQKHPSGSAIWNDETDTILIQVVKDVDSEKWLRVAALFNEQTGHCITPAEAALRTKVI